MSARFLSIIIIILVVLPLSGIVGLGGYFIVGWLSEHHWLYQAASIVVVDMMLIFRLFHSLSKKINT